MGKPKQSNNFGGPKNKISNNQPIHKATKSLRTQKPKQKYELKSKPSSKNTAIQSKETNKKDRNQIAKFATTKIHQNIFTKPENRQKSTHNQQQIKNQSRQPNVSSSITPIINNQQKNIQKVRVKSVDGYGNHQISKLSPKLIKSTKKAMPIKQKIEKVIAFLSQLQEIVEEYEQPKAMSQKHELSSLISYFEDKQKQRQKQANQTSNQMQIQQGQL